MSHTPGPWRTGWLESYDASDGEPVAYVYRRQPDDERETAHNRIRVKGGDDCDADAALIAAAPELLGMLKELVGHASLLETMSASVVERAMAAIAKAEGEPRGAGVSP